MCLIVKLQYRTSTILVTILLMNIKCAFSAAGKIDCGPLYDPQNDLDGTYNKHINWPESLHLGFVSYPNHSTTAGSIAKFWCEKGYYVYESEYAVCGKNGKWSIKGDLYCQRMECTVSPKRINIANGKVHTFTGPPYKLNSVYWVTCDYGYKPTGTPIRQCLESDNDSKYKGIWTQTDKFGKLLSGGNTIPECIRDENIAGRDTTTDTDSAKAPMSQCDDKVIVCDCESVVPTFSSDKNEVPLRVSETLFGHPAEQVVLSSYIIGMLGTIILVFQLKGHQMRNVYKDACFSPLYMWKLFKHCIQYLALAIVHCILPLCLLITDIRFRLFSAKQERDHLERTISIVKKTLDEILKLCDFMPVKLSNLIAETNGGLCGSERNIRSQDHDATPGKPQDETDMDATKPLIKEAKIYIPVEVLTTDTAKVVELQLQIMYIIKQFAKIVSLAKSVASHKQSNEEIRHIQLTAYIATIVGLVKAWDTKEILDLADLLDYKSLVTHDSNSLLTE